jgi:hypothetical protein
MKIMRGDCEGALADGTGEIEREARPAEPVPSIALHGIVCLRPVKMQEVALATLHQSPERKHTPVIPKEGDMDIVPGERVREEPLVWHALPPVRREDHFGH